MNIEQLKNMMMHPTRDIDFVYNGKDGSICPFSASDISITFDGVTTEFEDIDEALNAPIIDGKTLTQMSGDMEW